MRIALLFLLLSGVMAAAVPMNDGPEARLAYQREVGERFLAGKYAELEAEAARLRGGERMPDGLWRLPNFFEGITEVADAKGPAEFDRRIEEWGKLFPESETVSVVRAKWWVRQAWNARGNGYAHTVSPAGWKLFEEGLAKARTALESKPLVGVSCPHLYRVLLTVALGQGWDDARQKALFEAGVARWPEYYDFYFARAQYLLPRWYGARGDWEKFALDCAGLGGEGPMLYARIAWAQWKYLGQETGARDGVDWPLMREGFEKLMARWPESSWNRVNFCRFAFEMEDYPCASRWLPAPDAPVFADASLTPGAERFLQAPPKALPRPLRVIQTGAPACSAVLFLLQGEGMIVGTKGGLVARVEGTKVEPLFFLPGGAAVSKMALSPDGRLLAVGQGEVRQKTPGFAVIYDLAENREIARVDDWRGPVETVVFSHDGGTLFLAGGVAADFAEMKRWSWGLGVEPLHWEKGRAWQILSAASHPSRPLLGASWGRTVRVWDAGEGRALLAPVPPSSGGWVWSVGFSPDGRHFVSGSCPVYKLRGENSGGLSWWDAESFSSLPPKPDDKATGVDRMAFSPDGTQLYTTDQDGILCVRDGHDGRIRNLFPTVQRYVQDMAVSADGTLVATAGRDGTVKVWAAGEIGDHAEAAVP
jgi:hypothetical protein